MPQFDLSTLPAPELRQLLDSARQRGQAAQSFEILKEMEARRLHGEPPPLKRLSRRAARKSRTIELNLGDPLDADPIDNDFLADDEPPLTMGEPAPPPQEVTPPPVRVRQRWGHWATLCFALGLGGGVAVGWWAADGGEWQRPALSPHVAAAIPAPPRQPLPVVVAEAKPVPVPESPAVAPEPAADPEPAPAPDPAPAKLQAAASEASPCEAEPTPADRTICDAPELRRLQAELRQSYAAALEAHEDKTLLRQRELAWRDARSAVSDPDQLAGLYRQRIAQLKAATLDAERQRTTPQHEQRRRQASVATKSLG